MTTGANFPDWIRRELEELRRVRDELKLKVHLGKAEARESWERLERMLQTLEGKAKRASQAAEKPLQQLEQDLRKLAKDLREGYREIRGAL
jgi:hypothetical protein